MSRLEELVQAVAREHRCLQTTAGEWNLPLDCCFFGVPQSEFYGWTVLDELPAKLKGASFFLGEGGLELLRAFSQSKYAQQLESLAIGNSSFAIGKGLDYTGHVEAIRVAQFPQLKSLHLGIWELYSNSHCMYGKLGDVTQLLQNCPKLEDGTTGSNGGFISQSTLDALLESRYPQLREVFLDLECDDDDYGYRIPSTFQPRSGMPKLKQFEIAGGFAQGQKQRVRESFANHTPNLILHVEEMLES